MELSKQVCSLELAKRLCELGVKQESLFWWNRYFNKKHPETIYAAIHKDKRDNKWIMPQAEWQYVDSYSAFTTSELGEILLPNNDLSFSLDGDQFCVLYGSNLQDGHGEFADTEANARAKMRIYLLENKLV